MQWKGPCGWQAHLPVVSGQNIARTSSQPLGGTAGEHPPASRRTTTRQNNQKPAQYLFVLHKHTGGKIN